MTTESTST